MTLPETECIKVTTRLTAIRRFRRSYRRLDYYPEPAALRAINTMKSSSPDKTYRESIDYLVVAGFRAVTGNR
jgi:hypothetical protein